MQKLVIAEKPSVARSIAAVLGVTERKDGYLVSSDYIVSWCVGHLVGLSSPDTYDEKYKKWSFETLPIIPDNWSFTVNETTRKQFDILCELMNKDSVDEIVCATDAGREGECIFRYVYYKAGCKKTFKRLWVSSLEESAIREGFNELKNGDEYDSLYAAGLCRAKSDWLVGMNATRLFSVRYNARLNIGRVQTPTLAMIVKRDYEVNHFVKQKYFTVVIDCGTFTAATERIDSEDSAKSIAEKCNGKNAVVSSVKKEIKTVNPPRLFDLTTLQREANRQYGYTAQQTLDFTQSLYEKKLCTYPRTDSQFITDDMTETVENIVNLVCRYIPCCNGISIASPDIKRITDNKKVSDHHALLPTAQITSSDLNALSDGENNILSLISAKLICAVSEPHKFESVKAVMNCENTDFSATGKTIVYDGWKKIETRTKSLLKGGEDKEENNEKLEKSLPELTEGQNFENVSSSVSEHWTSPPKAYTEDTLLKAMETAGNKDYDENSDVEKKGLGTPATRAAIIENLVKREYVARNKKQLVATKKGVSLIEVVPEEVKSAKMTADWESEL
jgi:DNA topoisomerase-3